LDGFLVGGCAAKSFNHRKQWLVGRFKLLSAVFSIDVAAYAVMFNHLSPCFTC